MIYYYNPETKEHATKLPAIWDVWEHIFADADGWIPWEGGECPLPDGKHCEYKMRLAGLAKTVRGSEYLDWSHEGGSAEIVAYRPILDEPAEPEAVEWDGEAAKALCEIYFDIAASAYGEEEVRRRRDQALARTAAQRAEDEAVEVMYPIIDEVHEDGPVEIARTLYRAIRDGKVPGVKLDNN